MAQEFSVKSFSLLQSDLTALTQPRKDLNGEKCALVKVVLGLQGAKFEGNIIGSVEYKTGEYWVYMPQGSRMLKIKHPNSSPLMVTFATYGIDILGCGRTYELSMRFSNVRQEHQKQTLVIKYSPSTATVLVDNKRVNGVHGIAKATLPIGYHSYVVFCDGYESEDGSVNLKASVPSNLQITLSKEKIILDEKENDTIPIAASQPAQQETFSLKGSIASISNVSQNVNPKKAPLKDDVVAIPIKMGLL